MFGILQYPRFDVDFLVHEPWCHGHKSWITDPTKKPRFQLVLEDPEGLPGGLLDAMRNPLEATRKSSTENYELKQNKCKSMKRPFSRGTGF